MIIQEKLFALREPEYGAFQHKLMPTVSKAAVLGVRTPILRSFAKELAGTEAAEIFLESLPHAYYEENNLHAFLIEKIRDFSCCMEALEKFLPYIDNWATCDSLNPKILISRPEVLLEKICYWLHSNHIYTVRFAIGMLQRYYLEERFSETHPALVSQACCGEYYINMMVAWYFATALAKQYKHALPYLEEGRLPQWVHNKTIQKAIESYRITSEQKAYLRTLRKK